LILCDSQGEVGVKFIYFKGKKELIQKLRGEKTKTDLVILKRGPTGKEACKNARGTWKWERKKKKHPLPRSRGTLLTCRKTEGGGKKTRKGGTIFKIRRSKLP